jgi:hypothetical protein
MNIILQCKKEASKERIAQLLHALISPIGEDFSDILISIKTEVPS